MTFEIEKMVLVGLFISKPRSVETEIVPETTRFQKKPLILNNITWCEPKIIIKACFPASPLCLLSHCGHVVNIEPQAPLVVVYVVVVVVDKNIIASMYDTAVFPCIPHYVTCSFGMKTFLKLLPRVNVEDTELTSLDIQ